MRNEAEIRNPPKGVTRSIVRKLAEVMAIVERVAKSGRNEFHKYDYATEADVAAAVRGAMAERQLVMFPDVENAEFVPVPSMKGGQQHLCRAKVRFTLEDGESGETRSFCMYGEGQDAGDKASYKAVTGAEKYALLKLFLIPTGDDPEKDSPERNAAPRGAPAPQKAPESGIEAANKRLMSAGKGLAKDKPAPMRAVPIPKIVGPVMTFGLHKNHPMSSLGTPQLRDALETATKDLSTHPKSDYAGQLRATAAAISAELAAREG